MSESAAKLAASLSGEETSSDTTDNTLEEVEGQEVEESAGESTEETETTEETEEEELPDTVKEILKKNRRAVREAEARAVAAEKALAAKEKAGEESAEAPADDRFKNLYINTAAKTALVEAGLSTGTDRLLKLIDLSSVEVDESGAISGLDEQIADLKEDFKDLFAPKQVRKSTGNVDGSPRKSAPTPQTSAQKLASLVSR
jgi:hypothetical protein